MIKKIILIMIWILPVCSFAQRAGNVSDKIIPHWIKKGTPKPVNDTYTYLVVDGVASHLNDARNNSILELIMEVGKNNGIDVSSGLAKNILASEITDKDVNEKNLFNQEVEFNIDRTRMAFKKVDEYWVKRGERYYCSVLYAVANNPDTKNFPSLTTSSRASVGQVLMSVVLPGLGQMNKGRSLKGTLILGGEIIFASGIIVAENQRSSYIKKMKEQPKYLKEYGSKATNWENTRNILIGGAAALYIYNLIDVIASPASKRIRAVNEKGWRITPLAYNTPMGSGFGFGASFRF